MLTLTKDGGQRDFADYFTDKRRVLARGLLVSLDLPRDWLFVTLEIDPGRLLNSAVAFQRAANLLPRGDQALTPEQRLILGRSAKTLHAEWLNTTSNAMLGLPALQKAVGFTSAQIIEPVLCDEVLRIINHEAASTKDAAMDLRDISSTFGWMQVCVVLDWIRDNAPRMTPAAAQALLDDFRPLFLLIAQIQDQRASRAASLQAARASATAEAEEAGDQARKAQLWASFQADQPLSSADLMELALAAAEEAPTPPPAAKDKASDKDERKAPRARAKK